MDIGSAELPLLIYQNFLRSTEATVPRDVTQCLLEMTRLSLTRGRKGGGRGSGGARRTAAIMPDWLEFDPPGVESNRPTMLTEEKKRGPSFPSLLFPPLSADWPAERILGPSTLAYAGDPRAREHKYRATFFGPLSSTVSV